MGSGKPCLPDVGHRRCQVPPRSPNHDKAMLERTYFTTMFWAAATRGRRYCDLPKVRIPQRPCRQLAVGRHWERNRKAREEDAMARVLRALYGASGHGQILA